MTFKENTHFSEDLVDTCDLLEKQGYDQGALADAMLQSIRMWYQAAPTSEYTHMYILYVNVMQCSAAKITHSAISLIG